MIGGERDDGSLGAAWVFGAGARSLSDTAGSTPTAALLSGAHFSTSAAVDRVSFIFRSRPKSTRAAFVSRSALAGPSGRVVPVAGSAFLVIVMKGASGVDLSGPSPVVTYHGPKRIETAAARPRP